MPQPINRRPTPQVYSACALPINATGVPGAILVRRADICALPYLAEPECDGCSRSGYAGNGDIATMKSGYASTIASPRPVPPTDLPRRLFRTSKKQETANQSGKLL
jgi:hypothetical protein